MIMRIRLIASFPLCFALTACAANDPSAVDGVPSGGAQASEGTSSGGSSAGGSPDAGQLLDPMGGGGTSGSRAMGCAGDMTGIVRDFSASHPDFEQGIYATDHGIVEQALGSDDKPVYAHATGGTPTTNGRVYFDQWYRDVDGINLSSPLTLEFQK